ncbi:scarecrow-like transcription factor PAT1 [Senna tora]|uniref:Scarecrow-like transcription factor PAT1 n=1 Tax=Senna tora TaxID=362788 RepID=A0A834WRM3_9FABA|nr:scarecrow-like transcription factor PAT1 [Senna tora]
MLNFFPQMGISSNGRFLFFFFFVCDFFLCDQLKYEFLVECISRSSGPQNTHNPPGKKSRFASVTFITVDSCSLTMQASEHHTSPSTYYQPMQQTESYCFPQYHHQLLYCNSSDIRSHGKNNPTCSELYCTLESSSAVYNNSASTLSFSPNGGSPMSHQDSYSYSYSYPPDQHHSPDNTTCGSSCVTDDPKNNLKHKLRELESAMFGPDSDNVDSYVDNDSLMNIEEMDSWGRTMAVISSKDLKQVLVACARAIADDDMLMARWLMDELREMVSVSGEPIQRLGAYMLEGLVARLSASGSWIYRAASTAEVLSYVHVLYEVCPYFKFGYMSANGAIAEAMKDESRVHIIDFQIAQGSQWIALIQAFAARPGGPPRIRITAVVDDPASSAHGLDIVGKRLSRLARKFNVPFEFHAAADIISGCDVRKQEEALAVNFAFVLHHVPDESVMSTHNHRDRLLRLVKSLSPKVVTLVEQECNTNTAPFLPRFMETLDYYAAMFESMDVTLPRDDKRRINVEQHCLARDVVNIVACEGVERVERHEVLGKWRSRFAMAGFTPYPLSPLVNGTIKRLLDNYCHRYRLEERDGALYLGWMDRDLVASCAWK